MFLPFLFHISLLASNTPSRAFIVSSFSLQNLSLAMATSVDVEKQNQLHHAQIDDDSGAAYRDPAPPDNSSDARVRAILENNAILRFLVAVEKRIDGLTKFEAMGVERIPEDQRRPPQKLNVNNPLSVSDPKTLSAEDVLKLLPWKLYLTIE
jgi:hypothetical protein